MRAAVLLLWLLHTAFPLVAVATQLHPQQQRPSHRRQRSSSPGPLDQPRHQRQPLLVLTPASLEDCLDLAADGLGTWRKAYEACLSLALGQGEAGGAGEGVAVGGGQRMRPPSSPGFAKGLVRSPPPPPSSSAGILGDLLRSASSDGFLKGLVRSAGPRNIVAAGHGNLDAPASVFAGAEDSPAAGRERSDKNALGLEVGVGVDASGGEVAGTDFSEAVKRSGMFSHDGDAAAQWPRGRLGEEGSLKTRRSRRGWAGQQSRGSFAFRRPGRGGAWKWGGARTRRRHSLSVNSALDSLADMIVAHEYSRSRARQQAFREQLLDIGR